jgi:hypothetical protein
VLLSLEWREPRLSKGSSACSLRRVVNLVVVFAKDGTVKDVQTVSGEPLFSESAVKAVRQWRVQPILLNGEPQEADVSLSYRFSIQHPPKPAYLHLANGQVIRADTVQEFTDGIEYTVGHLTHRISADEVRGITACGHDCVAGGGPSFDIRAIPLLPSDKGTDAISH